MSPGGWPLRGRAAPPRCSGKNGLPNHSRDRCVGSTAQQEERTHLDRTSFARRPGVVGPVDERLARPDRPNRQPLPSRSEAVIAAWNGFATCLAGSHGLRHCPDAGGNLTGQWMSGRPARPIPRRRSFMAAHQRAMGRSDHANRAAHGCRWACRCRSCLTAQCAPRRFGADTNPPTVAPTPSQGA